MNSNEPSSPGGSRDAADAAAPDPGNSPAAASARALRKRAEETARNCEAAAPETLSPDQVLDTLHELRVHQIELEMQNEELRRAQVELDASRARYFDLYDLAPVGYVTLSEHGLILEANLAAATLLGVARSALVTQPITRFILKEDQDNYYLFRKQLLDTGLTQALELRMVKTDGTAFWTHLSATAARDPATRSEQAAAGNADVPGTSGESGMGRAGSPGRPGTPDTPAWRVVLSDITERKRVEAEKEKLEALSRQLQKAESLGRMAGAIAHHFNNKLQVVMGSLEMAQSALPRDEGKPAGLLTRAMQATRSASEISSRMLTYLGRTHDHFEALDLAEVCRRSLPVLMAAMPGHVLLEVDLPDPGPAVSGNANQIQQVLTNLATNAWEAVGDAPATIHLNVTTVAPAAIPATRRFPIGSQTRNIAYACLQVVDKGCGIPAGDMDNLFDPYFSSKFTGRGMGLAVVLGIVRAHDGIITVHSEPGSGSRFCVYLPLTAAAIPRPAGNSARSSSIMGSGSVLLVEDDEAVREVASMMLANMGFTVIRAGDGIEAVDLFRRGKATIRCVVCDLTMPRMNGWQTLAALRELVPGIPVILASGYNIADVMAGDHPHWPQAFLSKPYGLTELRDAVRKSLADPPAIDAGTPRGSPGTQSPKAGA